MARLRILKGKLHLEEQAEKYSLNSSFSKKKKKNHNQNWDYKTKIKGHHQLKVSTSSGFFFILFCCIFFSLVHLTPHITPPNCDPLLCVQLMLLLLGHTVFMSYTGKESTEKELEH